MKLWYEKKRDEFYQKYNDALTAGNDKEALAFFVEYIRYKDMAKWAK